ncbi:hypothetical protein [Streptacidiphilus jiangxiensis]|uniref:DMSO/TMAO reductase YedYZ, heme-binding membrane subunit n=1 Tax=Streptacidiphilus jiangxiensis TaxID=235985 RepID=A0A1H7S8B2_STRJI|nr:hypothetical protein [Streptacidiphilus jiangxiensis]SEL68549.1 DMSO/TMAO reductase YedYZ, heme-binding membrane subunit [Streptacidiphilus jiangxiensis]
MTMRQPRGGVRGRRGSRGGLLPALPPFPLFLLAVCAAVTIAATAVRALVSGGHAPQVLSGTAERLLAFLDYFAGVFTLLSLTAAVLCGLAATDRLVLTPRLRVAAQSVHRATSVAALGFLATHIGVKIAEHDASPLTALLPFGGGATFAVGLGTLAADLLVLAAATGAVRGRFADARRPGLWRVLHASAYACWPIALAHGLTAGRAAAVWVLWSYGVCGALVALALLIRALGLLDRLASSGRAGRARAYRARRPSRVALAELGALSREHEPVPYATRATRAEAREHAETREHVPAAAATSPDRPREHPRLADTPPHGVPVHGAFANNPGIPVQGAHRARAAGRPATAGPLGAWAGAAPTGPTAGAAWSGGGHGGGAGHRDWTGHEDWSGQGAPADLEAPRGRHAAGAGRPVGAHARTGAEAPAAAGAAAGGYQPAAAPTWEQATGQVPVPGGDGAVGWEHATGQIPTGWYGIGGWNAAGQVPGPGSGGPAGWEHATGQIPTGWYGTSGWDGASQVPGPGWTPQPGAMPGGWADWPSGEWGPLTWDAPAAGGVVG